MTGDEGRRVPARDGDRDGAVRPVGAADAREALGGIETEKYIVIIFLERNVKNMERKNI